MAKKPLIVHGSNLSHVWGQVFLALLDRGVTELGPVVATIRVADDPQVEEDQMIRARLDEALTDHGKKACRTVANTIFPSSLSNPTRPRQHLYSRYLALQPKLRKSNPYGTYFGRLISFPGHQGPVNQLERVIETYGGGNSRRSALQAAIFEPSHDLTNQRRRGFPCLQQFTFFPDGKGWLNVSAVLAVQYVFDRAYGNYLGLHALGSFMAREMGLALREISCVAVVALLGDVSKAELEALRGTVDASLRGQERG